MFIEASSCGPQVEIFLNYLMKPHWFYLHWFILAQQREYSMESGEDFRVKFALHRQG